MKSKRHNTILEIIEKNDVETQEDLILRLRNAGFDVTQATVSRDIRELKLTKVMGAEGHYKYVLHKNNSENVLPGYTGTISSSIKSVDFSMNVVVVKTYPGMAGAIAAVIDASNIKYVMGCVAGDDTIIVAVKDPLMASSVASEIRKISER